MTPRANRGRPDTYAGHEKAGYIREDAILDAVSAFYIDRVFGPRRRELLVAAHLQRPGSRTARHLAAITDLDAADQAEPVRATADDAELFDALPRLTLNLTGAPEELLRRLFEPPT